MSQKIGYYLLFFFLKKKIIQKFVGNQSKNLVDVVFVQKKLFWKLLNFSAAVRCPKLCNNILSAKISILSFYNII